MAKNLRDEVLDAVELDKLADCGDPTCGADSHSVWFRCDSAHHAKPVDSMFVRYQQGSGILELRCGDCRALVARVWCTPDLALLVGSALKGAAGIMH